MSAPARVADPVCGMSVDPATTPHHATHGGQDYAFCSAGCRGKFLADPQRYLAKAREAATAVQPVDATYTSPMHPEIRSAPALARSAAWRWNRSRPPQRPGPIRN